MALCSRSDFLGSRLHIHHGGGRATMHHELRLAVHQDQVNVARDPAAATAKGALNPPPNPTAEAHAPNTGRTGPTNTSFGTHQHDIRGHRPPTNQGSSIRPSPRDTAPRILAQPDRPSTRPAPL